jgi:hypothetical protein
MPLLQSSTGKKHREKKSKNSLEHRLDAKHLATTVKDFLEIPYLNRVERSIHIVIELKIKKQIQKRFEPIALDLGR